MRILGNSAEISHLGLSGSPHPGDVLRERLCSSHRLHCTAPSSRSIARLSRRHSRNAKWNRAGLAKRCKKRKRITEMDPVMKRMRDLPIDHLSYSGNKHVCYLQYISCISRTSLYVMFLKHRRRSKAMLLIFVYISLSQSVTYCCDGSVGSWYHRSSKQPIIKQYHSFNKTYKDEIF